MMIERKRLKFSQLVSEGLHVFTPLRLFTPCDRACSVHWSWLTQRTILSKYVQPLTKVPGRIYPLHLPIIITHQVTFIAERSWTRKESLGT